MAEQESAELRNEAAGLRLMDGLVEMPIHLIRRWRGQPRTWFDPEKLAELSADIRTRGRLLQPLRVRPDLRANQPPGGYLITVGERRYLASKMAGLETVTVIIDPVDDTQALFDALAENMHRQDLTPEEENEAVRRLRERGLKDQEIARRLGMSKSTISRLTAVFDDPLLGPQVADGRLTLTQARELLLLPPDEKGQLADYLRLRLGQNQPVGRTELRQLVASAMPTPPAGRRDRDTATPVTIDDEGPEVLSGAATGVLPSGGLRVEIGEGSAPPPLAARALKGFGADAPNERVPAARLVEPPDEVETESGLMVARVQREHDRAYQRSRELREYVADALLMLAPFVADPDVQANLQTIYASISAALQMNR